MRQSILAAATSACALLLASQCLADPIALSRYPGAPIVPAARSAAATNTPHSLHALNPAIVKFQGKYFMYFRSQREGTSPTISVWWADAATFDGVNWNQTPPPASGVTNPIYTKNSAILNEEFFLADPAAVVWEDQYVMLYFWGPVRNGAPRITLLDSTDGFNFRYVGITDLAGSNPIPWYENGTFYMITSTLSTNEPGNRENFGFSISTSDNGFNFSDPVPIINPSRIPGSFDEFGLTTARLFKENNVYYFMYGGVPENPQQSFDWPEGIGLYRSFNLFDWERYPKSPILLRGPTGRPDEGATWSPAYLRLDGYPCIYYEGAGSNQPAGTDASNKIRVIPYFGFSATGYSQIFTACGRQNLSFSDWSADGGFNPSQQFRIVNAKSGLVLDPADGSSNAGDAVTQRAPDGTSSQLWRLQDSAGFYRIVNASNPALVLEISESNGSNFVASPLNGARARLAPLTPGVPEPKQQWHIVPLDGGQYQLINRHSGQALEILQASVQPGAQASQRPGTQELHQSWLIQP